MRDVVRRHAFAVSVDKEDAIEQALEILAKAERILRLSVDPRLSDADRQQAKERAEAIMRDFVDHCANYSLRRADIEQKTRDGNMVRAGEVSVLLESKIKL